MKRKCPFCSDLNHFDAALEARPKSQQAISVRIRQDVRDISPEARGDMKYVSIVARAKERGKYWLLALPFRFRAETTKGKVEKRSEFFVEILGLKYQGRPPEPPPPFFQLDQINQPGKPIYYVSYQACRISCNISSIEVVIHWWPDHGHRVSVSGFPLDKATTADFEILKGALNLFHYSETRGKKESITERDVRAAVHRLERQSTHITRKALALNLNCNADTLRKWLNRHPKFLSIFSPGAKRP